MHGVKYIGILIKKKDIRNDTDYRVEHVKSSNKFIYQSEGRRKRSKGEGEGISQRKKKKQVKSIKRKKKKSVKRRML